MWRSVFAAREDSQRKEEKEVIDRRLVYWLLLFCFLFYVVVFHYLANLPLSKEAMSRCGVASTVDSSACSCVSGCKDSSSSRSSWESDSTPS